MRVLVVEDHDDTRDALERFLSRCGYGVAVAADLRSAMNLLQAQPFDALVTDIALPDGTGYALVSDARRRGINVMAIALTAYSYPRDVEEPKVTGFDYYLTKPLDCIKLRSLLREAEHRDSAPAGGIDGRDGHSNREHIGTGAVGPAVARRSGLDGDGSSFAAHRSQLFNAGLGEA
jgi:DNA-binding response OmpR family regulator